MKEKKETKEEVKKAVVAENATVETEEAKRQRLLQKK